MQLRNGRRAGLGCAQVALAIRPAASPPGPDQDDRTGRDIAMRLFPRRDVGLMDAVIGARIGLVGHVDHDRRSDQLVERDLIRAALLLHEMHGRIEVCAAVLGRGEVVGGVVPAARHAPG